MPSFTATDAILYAAAPGLDFDDSLLLSLKEELFLLVESCIVSVEQGPDQVRQRPDGTRCLRAVDPGELVWEIEARCAFFNGLADYHPGAALSRQALGFANGPDFRVPFQFENEGTLIYERPRQTMKGGTLPAIAFAVRLVGGATLDQSAYPESGTPPLPDGGDFHVVSIYWTDDTTPTPVTGRFIRVHRGTAPTLASLFATGTPGSASYPAPPEGSSNVTNYETDNTLTAAGTITITGVYLHSAASWLLGSSGTPSPLGEVLSIAWYYDTALEPDASNVPDRSHFIGGDPPAFHPDSGGGRAAWWTSDEGWLQPPLPAWESAILSSDPPATFPGLLF